MLQSLPPIPSTPEPGTPEGPGAPPPPLVHRVAFRVALTVTLSVVAAVALGAVVGRQVLGEALAEVGISGLGLAVVAGMAAYMAVQRRIGGRLELARRTLREARKRRFDGLGALAEAANRDEVDALVRQVYGAGRALQAEIERLETMETYRRDFLGDVSHELRTPIFAVTGFAETLLGGALEDDRVRRRFVEKILANARRLEALTRDLTDISKFETGRMELRRAPFALRPLAVEIAEGLERLAVANGIDLQVRVPEALPLADGDRDRIRQVVANLVENALTYANPGGHVEIAARRLVSGDLRISVVDDGIGIPAEDLPRLTDRFFRVDKSRAREQGGTGLGLSIVKHILEAHGQRLAVESRPGYGSSFAFTLPAA
ncbi:MAG TPA: ATP-binding protein, partial [Rubricoccaceae bacterium]